MPKVLRILNRLNLGGPTWNAAYLSKFLAPEFETLLLSGMKDDSEASSEFIAREMGLEPRYISGMHREINFSADYSSYRELKNIIRSFRPDIVHTHAAKAGALGRLAAASCHVPVILHTFHGHVFHSYFGKLKTRVFIEAEKYLASKSDAIVAISERQKEELAGKYHICDASKIHVIPLGFDLQKFRENQAEKRKMFREKYLLDEDEIAIGILGRIVPVKNHKLFLSALKIVSGKTSRKIRAFIIGDGEFRQETENAASSLGLSFVDFTKDPSRSLITFTSWIKEADVAIAGLDIVALSSLNEGTPVSLIEAQAGSKAIVTTRVGGVEDVIIPGRTALLSESDNEEDFSQKLLQLVENENLRKSMGTEGWNWVREKYHYSRLVESTRTLYHDLLQDKIK